MIMKTNKNLQQIDSKLRRIIGYVENKRIKNEVLDTDWIEKNIIELSIIFDHVADGRAVDVQTTNTKLKKK